MRILLFGANGQVGHELRRSLAPLGEIIATTRSGRFDDGDACEIADFEVPEALPVLIERIAPSLVVNAAAYTAVDKAEADREAAFRANAEAPSRIAESCARMAIPLVHYSTDYVFDGTGARPYREDDPTSPLGVYGESKLAGEQGIRASGASHMILRTAWVYAAHGKNFLRTMLRLGAERDTLGVVADQIGTPTSAGLIADVTATLVPRIGPASGTWHLTASGETSWHGFAEAIFAGGVARGLLSRAPQVNAIATAEYPTPARRPAYSRLDTSRLQSDFGVELPEWRTVCDHVLDDIAGSFPR